MSDWLDLELAHRLGPVAAPAELWERIERGRARSPRPARSWSWRFSPVPVLAALTLTLAAAWISGTGVPQAAAVDLRSSDPAEIRAWLQRHAGVDVPLRASTGIRLEGARVLGGADHRVAAIAFRIGRDSATLLVAHADPACPLPPHGAHTAAWQARDQVYTMACSNPDRAEAACLLCHASL